MAFQYNSVVAKADKAFRESLHDGHYGAYVSALADGWPSQWEHGSFTNRYFSLSPHGVPTDSDRRRGIDMYMVSGVDGVTGDEVDVKIEAAHAYEALETAVADA